MKNTKILLIGLLALAPFFSVQAATPVATGCEAKRQNIEQQIEHARTHGNNYRIAGLNKAFSEHNAHCTDAGLRAEREDDVRKKEQKVEARRQELIEAKAGGSADKISKKQRKLEEAQTELDETRSMLDK